MKAMLLSAGRGERLEPLSRVVPKPVIPVLGRPLALQILHRLAALGVTTAVVNLHHEPEKIRQVLGEGADLGLPSLHFTHEKSLLGTAGGVRNAASLLRGGETILVRNADFLADVDLGAVTAAHLASGCPATLVLAAARPGYTPVDVDETGRILSFGGEPPCDPGRVAARCMFTGFQLIEEEVLERIPSEGPSDLVRHVYRPMAAEGCLASHVHGGFWQEFGTPEDYLEGSLRLLAMDPERRARIAATDPVERFGSARVAVGAGADFHHGVDLRGGVALGLASLIGEGVCLEDAVVMPEAWIGPGSRLRRVVVGPGTEIPAGLEIEDALICSDVADHPDLPPGTERLGGLLVRQLGRCRV